MPIETDIARMKKLDLPIAEMVDDAPHPSAVSAPVQTKPMTA
jgi:hypothetical protein